MTSSLSRMLWFRMSTEYFSKFVFLKRGERSTEIVSQYLQSLDFGVASSPYSLIYKSGTAISMLEHGLQVIVNREDVRFPAFKDIITHSNPQIIRIDSNFNDQLYMNKFHHMINSRLPKITAQFLDELESQIKISKNHSSLE